MKNVILKQMRLLNFKGIRELTVDFNERQTDICGDNGTGKSTIFDAFTWVLFGKNSAGKEQFGIKTVDKDNVVIPKIPHEAELLLGVDGEDVKLTRIYREKWVKKKNSATEKFEGHETELFYNDVPCNTDEWKSKIADICNEEAFRFITNPFYFTSQKPEVQRARLLRMAGGVSDADIAAGNADFTKLLANLKGKTLGDYKKEITAKKRKINSEKEGLPSRIDERRRDLAADDDWPAIESELAEKNSALAEIERQLLDHAEARRAKDDRRMKLLNEINAVREEKSRVTYEITEATLADYRKSDSGRRKLADEVNECKRKIRDCQALQTSAKSDLESARLRREKLIAEWRDLGNQSKAILAEAVSFDDKDFICPQCGRPYEADDIERVQLHRMAHFEEERKKRLTDIADKIKDNERRGKAERAIMESLIAKDTEYSAAIDTARQRITDIEALELYKAAPEAPDTATAIASDPRIAGLIAKEKTLSEQYDAMKNGEAEDTTLADGKKILTEAIDELKKRLYRRDEINKDKARIAELEAQLQTLSDEVTQLDGIEFTIQQFSKARIVAVESRINSMFSLVRFKLFEQQVNGAEVETCVAMVDGVTFPDLNFAKKINAGLDIINTICKSEGLTAPVFIDSAESINSLTPVDSQIVRLIVTQDKQLTVKNDPTRLF